MAKIVIFYSKDGGTNFDMKYYCEKFVPFLEKLWGDALKGVKVDRGVYGGEPDTDAFFIAMGQFIFDTQEEAIQAYFSNLDKIKAEKPNFTDIEPIVQISQGIL